MQGVNTAFLNGAFNLPTILRMHPSTKRLLDAAKEATEGAKKPITDFPTLIAQLGVTSAVMTNWKARGVSKDGALLAEKKLGIAPAYVLAGEGPARTADRAKRAMVVADIVRDSASLREFARLQVKDREDLSPEQRAQQLAALDSLEREAQTRH